MLCGFDRTRLIGRGALPASHHVTSVARWFALTVALFQGACQKAVPEQRLSRPATGVHPVIVESLGSGPWGYRTSTERRGYRVEQRAIVEIHVASTVRRDTVGSEAELAFSFYPADERLSGSLSAFSVLAPDRQHAVAPGLVLPVAFAGELPANGRQIVFTSPDEAAPCAQGALSVLQSLRDVWLRPPDTLRLLGTWSDSAAFRSCRDGIPLLVRSSRSFTVVSATVERGRPRLVVRRESASTITGSGTDNGNADVVEVSGASTGHATYELYPTTGELARATGTATLELTLSSRHRVQSARQVTTFVVRSNSVDKP